MNKRVLCTQLLLCSMAYNRCKYHINDLRMMFDVLDKQTSADNAIVRHLISLTRNIVNDLEAGHQSAGLVDSSAANPCNDNGLHHYLRQ